MAFHICLGFYNRNSLRFSFFMTASFGCRLSRSDFWGGGLRFFPAGRFGFGQNWRVGQNAVLVNEVLLQERRGFFNEDRLFLVFVKRLRSWNHALLVLRFGIFLRRRKRIRGADHFLQGLLRI